jgi:hypothetical protein
VDRRIQDSEWRQNGSNRIYANAVGSDLVGWERACGGREQIGKPTHYTLLETANHSWQQASGVSPERRLLKVDLGAMRSEFALEEHMILEILRFRSGRGTPGATLPMTSYGKSLAFNDLGISEIFKKTTQNPRMSSPPFNSAQRIFCLRMTAFWKRRVALSFLAGEEQTLSELPLI